MKPISYILYPIIIAGSIFLYARYLERRSLYFPIKEIIGTPSSVNLDFEDIYLKAEDGVEINAWFVPADDARYTLLFFHGNGGNISHRLEKISFFHKMGLNVFIVDYHGYGKSKGSPSEPGLYMDAEATYKYLIKEKSILPDGIILYGESLGGAVACNLAKDNKVKALITEDTFTSIKDMAEIIYPFLPTFFLKSKFNTEALMRNLEVPKLIIHSTDDDIVPFELGEILFEEAKEPKKFLKLKGSHNTAFFDSVEDFQKGIEDFLNNL